MIRSADPIYDYMRYDEECYNWINKRPECCECGNHIQDEYGYHIGGNWFCKQCMDNYIEYIE